MSVVNNIKKYRRARDLTQEELAGALAVSRQTVISIEKGNYVPSVQLALKCAEYFKVSVEKLFILESNK